MSLFLSLTVVFVIVLSLGIWEKVENSIKLKKDRKKDRG